MATTINAIDKESIHKICSGQVVLDLATAVKELVENSIDAGANSIDVNFKESGIEGFEVIDNGYGIDPVNYESLALKHYTSKLNSFEDLESVLTFGFRGEALSSLCALSNLTVITATKAQAPMGVKLEYDHNGILTSKQPISRTHGTTIQLSNIFHSLPVRLQEFKRNIKREFSKALTVLQAYSIISQNIRMSVNNQSGKRSSVKVMATSKNKDISSNISNIFGAKLVSQIIPFKVDLESIVGEGTVEGFISKPEWGIGRSSSDRQYYYVNGRPCTLPKIAKTLNEIYRIYISNQYPVVIADLKIPTNSYDVNVSPDKRTIFIHNESKIAEMIMDQLKEQLEPSRSTFQVNALVKSSADSPATQEHVSAIEAPVVETISTITKSNPEPSLNFKTRSISSVKPITSLGSFAMPSGNKFKPKPISNKRSLSSSTATPTLLNFMNKKPKVEEDMEVDELEEEEDVQMTDTSTPQKEYPIEISLETPTVHNKKVIDTIVEINSDIPNDLPMEQEILDDREYIESQTGIKSFKGLWNTVGRTMTIHSTNFNHLKSVNRLAENDVPLNITEVQKATLSNASVQNIDDNEKATRALSRVISKPDFARMEVIGQFNLGFMITNLDDKDLYIIDQHASDEKYNFETLQKTTQIKEQRLLSSPILDLTAAEEHIVMDNIDIFKANGFNVEILPDNEPTKRIRVVSQPVSKNTMFDKKDFSEIIFLISEHPGEMVRCSRNRAMFASRACHKAVRIGDSLNKRQMTKIVRHMGEIDQPWNCPHGRPTMRHLLSLAEFKQSHSYKSPKRNLSFSGSLFKKAE